MTAPHPASDRNGHARGEVAAPSLPAPTAFALALARILDEHGPATALAVKCGLSVKDVYRWATDPDNASGEHRAIPAHAVVTITRVTGRLDALQALADQVGCVVVPRPEVVRDGAGLLAKVAELTREFGEAQSTCADALADGAGISTAEAFAIDQALAELEAAAERIRLLVRDRAGRLEDARRPLAKAGR